MVKAVDIAYETIRDGIRNGTYPPGSHLTAQALAEASGFSRTPVREAMRRLHAEALIQFIPNRGAFVATWSRREIEQIYDLRILLESFAAREAALHISDEQLARLREIAQQMHAITQRDDPDIEKVTDLNDEFHKLVLDASGNVRLRDLLGSIVEIPLVLNTFRSYSLEQIRRSSTQHLELADAFSAREPDWAAAIMTAHIRSARQTLMSKSDAAESSADPGQTGLVDVTSKDQIG
ncbi:GntR family transcriptional regulator [Pelagerythrobacter rhizovicinus]|uniref:GntR family transcriptional regulator n=1 Tax=Pelagerythrobacter rhizovicinus TaxID=2268576 RepID=A0A4Q2KN15_9SPHN|nr:GntR family transcriptional regulator [Pelagerythrobacter rhizovicinus]RXZ64823.1 GntR family transcriptional regulator [Pelagerythrobacter rhizovicinus]